MEEMRVEILSEVLTLVETMQNLYEELVTMHKGVVHLHGLQQQWKDFFKTLRNVKTAIIIMHEWMMWYKGASLDLGKKMKPQVELKKERVQMLIQSNKQLTSFVSNIHDSYAWLYNNLDFLVKSHMIPSVGSFTKDKPKNKVRKEIEQYLEKVRNISTKEDLEVNR